MIEEPNATYTDIDIDKDVEEKLASGEFMTLDELLQNLDKLIASFDEPEPIVTPNVRPHYRKEVCVG